MKASVIMGHAWPMIAPDGPIGGREAMELCDHPRAMEGRWITSGPCMVHTSFRYNYDNTPTPI